MQKIVLASSNAHKIKEFNEILEGFEVIAMKDIGFCEDIVEDGDTLLDNSLIKCKAIRKYLDNLGLDYPVIADDSGLFCRGLNGKPGVKSARYSGVHGDDEANRQKLIAEINEVEDKSAYFGCIIALMQSDGKTYIGDGRTYGTILESYEGDTSFGYDCIFMSNDLNKSFGVATSEEKNSVSHRGRALQDLMKSIKENNYRMVK